MASILADLNNVQALVARSSRRPFLAVLLFRIGTAGKAREFLRLWAASTLGGEAPEVGGVGTFHFMFSWNGLAKLLDGNLQFDVAKGRAEFEPFFVDPKQGPDSLAAASDLGFSGESSPDGWWDGFKSGDIDLAIHMAFESETQRKDDLDRIRTSAAKQDLEELRLRTFPDSALTGYRPPGGGCISSIEMELPRRELIGTTPAPRPLTASIFGRSLPAIQAKITRQAPGFREYGKILRAKARSPA